ncbi:MAG: BACON domain-containing protein [Bacteroidales bacterium]|nr:BACON domain-containing protein [Bacteroidales bacterium]
MMRKLLTFLQAVAIATLIAGCGGTGTENEPEITPEIKFTEDIVTSGISVESAEQSITLSFSTNVAWSATVSADWLTISPSSGEAGKNSVKVEVEENRTGQPRSATITISDKESMQKVSVTIRQEALKASLTVSPESLEFSANKGEEMLNVTSNTDWVITKDAEWITLDSDKGKGLATIAAGVTENTSLTSRTGIITVSTSDGSVKKTVSVRQSGADVIFTIDKNEFNVAAVGESFSVKVTRNIGYKINSQPEWVKQPDKANSGNVDTYTFTAEANTSTEAREGVIVFCNDNNECVPVTVKQAGANATLSVSPAELTFTANTESKSLDVTSNTAWTAASGASWAKLNKTNGSGNAQIAVTAEENTAITQRSATITIKTADGKASATVKVTQSAANVIFSVDKNEHSVATAGGDFTVKVTHNIGYKINSQPEWVKQADKTTSGNTDTFSFKAEANTSTVAREGVIVFCNDNNECVPVTVKQAGANATLSVSPASMTFTAKSESKTFTVTSNTDWTMTSDAAWVKLSATDGSGNAQVTVTAEENTATKQRIATITLKTKDGKTTATVKLSQNGADIIFRIDGDNREYKVEAEGGEIQFFVIHNIECYLKKNPEWVILDNMQTYNGATCYKLKVLPNTSTSERGGIIVIRGLAENECELEILVIQAAGKPKGGNENTTTGGEITIE